MTQRIGSIVMMIHRHVISERCYKYYLVVDVDMVEIYGFSYCINPKYGSGLFLTLYWLYSIKVLNLYGKRCGVLLMTE